MSFALAPHAAAGVFFVALVAFELVRRGVSLLRPPTNAYLARGALAALYFSLAGLDPARWLDADADALVLGAVLAALVAIASRAQLASALQAPPAMLLPATMLAVVVAAVEELVFRGAFVLPASFSVAGSLLALVGSSAAYVAWRAIALRERSPRALAIAFVASLALAATAASTRSLWPALLAHAAFVLARGRP